MASLDQEGIWWKVRESISELLPNAFRAPLSDELILKAVTLLYDHWVLRRRQNVTTFIFLV